MKIDDIENHLETLNAVASEYLKGTTTAQIAKELAIPRHIVSELIDEWKQMASNNEAVRARARQALAGADQHYNALIGQLYRIQSDADDDRMDGSLSANQQIQAKLTATKMVADLEAKRIDMLQKAGLLENAELAEQLIEQEKQMQAVMAIISEVVGKCPTCKQQVVRRMAQAGGSVIIEGQLDG